MANRVYEGEHGLRVEGIAVCSYTSESLTCWDMDGVKNDHLADYVASRLQNDIPFKLHRKNRLVLIRIRNDIPSITYSFNDPDQESSFRYVASTSNVNGMDELLALNASPNAAFASVMLQVQGLPSPTQVDVPLRGGRTARFQGSPVSYAGAKHGKSGTAIYPFTQILLGNWWNLFIQGLEGVTIGNLNYTLLDNQGQPILYVDRNGHPVPPMKYLKWSADHSSHETFGDQEDLAAAEYKPAFVTPAQTAGDGLRITTNIDPQIASALRIKATGALRVKLTGFPLDQKEGS